MPVNSKTRTASGRLQQHHRTSSGGSSKVGINNLQLTQKDATQPKQQNIKNTGHSAVELHQARAVAHFPRPAHLTSTSRVRSKDQIAAAQQRRVHAPLSSKGKQQQTQQQQTHLPQRPTFSLAHSDDTTDDDDEWVSSESGAATPQPIVDVDKDETIQATTPVERQRAGLPAANGNGNTINGNTDRPANGVDDVTTPRAEVNLNLDLTRVDTIRPDVSSFLAHEQMKPPVVFVQAQSTPATPISSPPPTVEQQKEPPVRQSHSEAPSPSQLRQKEVPKRQALVRHSTTHGEKMPPHPLIRGQSYHGSALRLAPLTVNSEAAQAQLTGSPSSPRTSSRAGSPLFLSSSVNKSPSDVSTESHDRLPSRKTSISSLHSIATLPAPASSRFVGGRAKQDRTRTLSTISMSSSSAALNALSTLPSMSRPSSPPIVVRFPAESRRDTQDVFHQLLPPVYLVPHLTDATKYNPLYDCYERVMRAKHGQ